MSFFFFFLSEAILEVLGKKTDEEYKKRKPIWIDQDRKSDERSTDGNKQNNTVKRTIQR